MINAIGLLAVGAEAPTGQEPLPANSRICRQPDRIGRGRHGQTGQTPQEGKGQRRRRQFR